MLFHPDKLQELCDEAIETDDTSKIEVEADLLLSAGDGIEETFVNSVNFARKHGRDISRMGMYKIECPTSIMIFLAESEEEVVMRVTEALRR